MLHCSIVPYRADMCECVLQTVPARLLHNHCGRGGGWGAGQGCHGGTVSSGTLSGLWPFLISSTRVCLLNCVVRSHFNKPVAEGLHTANPVLFMKAPP